MPHIVTRCLCTLALGAALAATPTWLFSPFASKHFSQAHAQQHPRTSIAIEKMDRDGDGKVSRGEFIGPPPRFGVFDVDGDGFITAGEFDASFGGAATRTAPAVTTAFDGTWTGSPSSRDYDCIPGDMKLHVASGKISGALIFNSRQMGSLESSVSGQVNPDGSASLNFEPKNVSARSGGMRGTFSESRFTGSMDGRQCTYAVSLSKQ